MKETLKDITGYNRGIFTKTFCVELFFDFLWLSFVASVIAVWIAPRTASGVWYSTLFSAISIFLFVDVSYLLAKIRKRQMVLFPSGDTATNTMRFIYDALPISLGLVFGFVFHSNLQPSAFLILFYSALAFIMYQRGYIVQGNRERKRMQEKNA